MNVIEYKNFFNAVTRAFAELPEFYATMIRHGFDPRDWPECEGKLIPIEFDRLARERGTDYAQLHTIRKVSHLHNHPLPDDKNALICEFGEYKKYGLYRELGQALLSDPLRGTEALARFKAHAKSGVSVANFREEILDHVQKRIELGETGTETDTLVTDWMQLSRLIGGFNPGRVILLVAGTGVGKTTFALNVILSAVKTMPVLCFNMEMFRTDIYDRLCMAGAGITTRDWKHMGRKDSVDKAAGLISSMMQRKDLLVTDGRTLTIEQITAQMHQSKDSHDIKLVFVDYDQKIRTRYQGEEWQTLQRAIEDLEEAAKETNTCVIGLRSMGHTDPHRDGW